jgi:FkbM family methyltransferase
MAKAILTWPRFSLTSFNMVSDLVCQEVLPKTVIDVGANTGQFAIASAMLFRDVEVHCFEPHPKCFLRLKAKVAALKNISLYNIAIGDDAGEVPFHLNSYSHSSSLLFLSENHLRAFPNARECDTIKVEVSTLDATFAKVELRGPVLLKIDVQGYESQVILGAIETLKRVDFVVIETSFKPMYQDEILFTQILRLMEEQGFFFVRPVGFLFDPKSDEIIQMDALFRRSGH